MIRSLSFFMALFCLIALPVYAADTKSDKFLDIQEVKTNMGLTAWLVQDNTLPLLSMKFAFRDAGSTNDSKEKQGLTQLLSNTLDEGAGEMDSQAFQKALNDNSISLSFSGGRDSFEGSLKTLKRNQDKAFNLLKLALTQPRFDPEPVQRMKDANLTRIRSSLSDPEWKAARLNNDIIYAGHPYALNSGGTLSTLPTITADDLRQAVQSRFGKDRLFIAVTGDISADDLATILDDVFGHLPDQSQVQDTPEITIQNAGILALHKSDIPQTVINITLPAFGRDDPDFYTLQVLNYIYGGGGFGSRLMDEVREKRGLTYGIYSSLNDMRLSDSLSISTSTNSESVAETLNIIKSEMSNIRENGVTQEELNNAKAYLTGSMPLSLSSTDRISSMVLSLQMQDLPIDHLDYYENNIDKITLSDLQKVAERVLKPENTTTILVGNPQNITPTTLIEDLPNVN